MLSYPGKRSERLMPPGLRSCKIREPFSVNGSSQHPAITPGAHKIVRWRLLLVFCAVVAFVHEPVFSQTTLYNGIRLPDQWPPRRDPTQVSAAPWYLETRPAVIPIDIGRQLFVDDFLIQRTSLIRTAHRPVVYADSPVLSPGGPDLKGLAFPYSDGVWYDPADRIFKMWYLGSYGNMISYAYSSDGKHWIKPPLPTAVIPQTNTVLQIGGGRDSATVWMDLEDRNPARKFKAFAVLSPPVAGIYFSPDGIHWDGPQQQTINSVSDRTTVFWNPFRKVWVDSVRSRAALPATRKVPGHYSRVRFYSESPDLLRWNPVNPLDTFWVGPDEEDPPYAGPGGALPELYNLDAVAYESLLVGLFSWFNPGPGYDTSYGPGPNLVELGVGFSRDGFHWSRPTRGGERNAFIAATGTAGSWNAYNVQSVGGGFLVVGDELWFYFSGRSQQKPAIGIGATGLAVLRRDGFYSMNAGTNGGVLTTLPIRFSGKYLFVNVADQLGTLQVEILDSNGRVIEPFTKGNSAKLSVDKTLQQVTWNGAGDLSKFAGKPVEFRFYLTNGALYSFWVSPDLSGASNGYEAAGGPGFTSAIDTVGSSNISNGSEKSRLATENTSSTDTPTIPLPNDNNQHYVSPNGSSMGDGSAKHPWELQAALSETLSVRPGDIIWLRQGVYGNGSTIYKSSLNGTSKHPIVVRQYPGERATINGGITVGGIYTWFWGFEVTNRVISNRSTETSGDSPPRNFPSAFTVFGIGSRFINLIVHDTAEGFGLWASSQDAEIYGSLIYNNGWQGRDRGHGHGIYTQNQTGLKTISDNIIFQGFGLGIQCYGSPAAYIQNYLFDGNTIFNSGTLAEGMHRDYNLLVTGGHGPQNISVTNNYTYHTPSAGSGTSALNRLAAVQANHLKAIANYWIGGNPAIAAFNWNDATFTANVIYSQEGYLLMAGSLDPGTVWDQNRYYGTNLCLLNSKDQPFEGWRSATGLDRNSTFSGGSPKGSWIFVRPNRYEAQRANITIYNWDLAKSVAVDLSKELSMGSHFEVRNAQDYFGAVVVSGIYSGGSISIPMSGLTVARPQGSVPTAPRPTGPEFGAFVLSSVPGPDSAGKVN